MNRLGKNITNIRKSKKWRREDLAYKSGLAYSTIAKLENGGIRNPTIETVTKLANIFHIRISKLIGK